MAYSQPLSSSVRTKGQAAMTCELCEDNPKLKWKCLDCELMMCQRCKDKVHNKISSAQDHTILDIKEINKHQTDPEPQPDLTRITCEVHSRQKCCLYCQTCKTLVCQTCIAKTHKKHDFSEISDEYQIQLERVKIKQRNIETKIHDIVTCERELQHIKANEQSKYEKVEQEILDDDKVLKDEIQKNTYKLLKKLGQKQKAFTNKVENEETILQEQQRQIQREKQKINSFVQQNKDNHVFSIIESVLESPEITVNPTNTLLQGVPKFTRGDKVMIALASGKLDDVSVQNKSELQIAEMFVTKLTTITSISSCSNGSLWICDDNSNTVQKVNRNRGNLSLTLNFTIDIYDATLFPSGHLLMSVGGSPNLKLVPCSSTDIQDSVYSVSPLRILCVHVTCDNKVIVGAVNNYEIPGKEPRKVIVMDSTGHHEKTFKNDTHNKPLFTLPYRVTSNIRSFIAVVDLTSDDNKGRVITLNKQGEIRNIYTGHRNVNNEHTKFSPRGITTTPSDNFVVADMDNHTLHILNSEGELVTFYKTEKLGILLPLSLSFSTSGQLFIGCGTYDDTENNAKLFLLNNLDF